MKSSSLLPAQIALVCMGLSQQVLADTTEETIGVSAPVVQPDLSKKDAGYSPSMPSEMTKAPNKKVYTAAYLKSHPKELEGLLTELIRLGNQDGLKALLPIYRQVPTADPSVFDWGQAIIAMNEGEFEKAVKLYRKIHAKLPESKSLRYQMSMALMANGELEAAKDQFEKLRSSATSPQDIQLIDGYVKAIESRDAWSFSGGVTYAYNKNVNNAAPEGTTISDAYGRSLTSKTKPKPARGVSYNFSADKKTSLTGLTYLGFHSRLDGTHYFNERNYGDLTARVGLGFGLRTPRSNVELIPFAQKRLYGFAESGDESLHDYATTIGARLEGSHWLNQSWRYQGALEFGKDSYVDDYDHLEGKTILLSNTAMYSTGNDQVFYGGIDLNMKDTDDPVNSYDRYGLRLGWQKGWDNGFSTGLNVGYGRRFVKGMDFSNVKRVDTDYSASASVWNRAWHWKGITPRLTFSYNETQSNQPFYEYKNNKVFVEFSKTF